MDFLNEYLKEDLKEYYRLDAATESVEIYANNCIRLNNSLAQKQKSKKNIENLHNTTPNTTPNTSPRPPHTNWITTSKYCLIC